MTAPRDAEAIAMVEQLRREIVMLGCYCVKPNTGICAETCRAKSLKETIERFIERDTEALEDDGEPEMNAAECAEFLRTFAIYLVDHRKDPREQAEAFAKNLNRAAAFIERAPVIAPARTEMDFAWVIEGSWSPVSDPAYWAGSSMWVRDHLKAIRFARKEDADNAAMMMCAGVNVRICEHGWSRLTPDDRERG
jgi:hypothetical protein